jgi:hypothetical protein
MVVAPLIGCDRDCEMANGEKLAIATAAPNAPMADRRLKARLSRASDIEMFECSTIFLHPFGNGCW